MKTIDSKVLFNMPTLIIPEDCWYCYKLKTRIQEGSKISFYCLGDTPCLLSKDFFIPDFLSPPKND